MSSNPINVRLHALNVLHSVLVKHYKAKASIEWALKQQIWEPRDAALLRELVYGVLRFHYTLEADISRFIKQKPDERVRLALLLGAYQIRYMRIPPHAAVGETVAIIKPFAPEAAGFVNAVLRKVTNQEPPTKFKPSQRAELPKWMYNTWRDAFGAEAVQHMAEHLKQTPDLCIAVFKHRETWIKQAEEQGIEAKIGTFSPHAVLLSPKTNVSTLPGYDEGKFTVMDQAAQAAAMAVEINEESATILDLCAAPGGKTALIAHRFPKAHIVAVELNPKRIPRLQENLQRLSCDNVEVLQADCASLPYADNSIDAIMLDAPCSASGTLRRHPDAKFLHDEKSMESAAKLQTTLLTEAMRVLKPKGTVVYAVCSIHPTENENVINAFKGVRSSQRLFPNAEHDGFFSAQIIKASS
ncbi:MAG: 16S rRNA (cytosine(967)-C(5))-methyltransferase RsmB [Ghiorsea sp.]